jgi:hypothetical protein
MSAQVEKLHPQAALAGHIDAIADGKVYGWAWNREHPGERLTITVAIGDAVVATGLADQSRPDLAASGIGDGAHAFALDLPEGAAAEQVRITAGSPGSGASQVLNPRPAPLEAVPQELQQVRASVHTLQQVQKQTAHAVMGVLKEMRQKGDSQQLSQLEQAVADIQSGQQALMKRFETIEVFLLRFDTLMRQFDEKLTVLPRQDRGPALTRLMVTAGVVTAVAITAMMMVWK